MKEFTDLLVGDLNISQFGAAFIFALIGAFLSLRMNAAARNVTSERTPVKFNFDFLLSDNAKRIGTTIILIFIALRFAPELIGTKVTVFSAFAIGYANDKIAQLLKNVGFLGSKATVVDPNAETPVIVPEKKP